MRDLHITNVTTVKGHRFRMLLGVNPDNCDMFSYAGGDRIDIMPRYSEDGADYEGEMVSFPLFPGLALNPVEDYALVSSDHLDTAVPYVADAYRAWSGLRKQDGGGSPSE